MNRVLAPIYPEVGAGGFTKFDGTVEFYARINALLEPGMEVVDLGAGRGCQFEDEVRYRRDLITIQGKVEKVIGLDVDPAVMKNQHVDERLTYDGGKMPLADGSADLIFCDWVLEHIENPGVFSSEIGRVLKSGGWFCARTPAKHSLIATASRVVPNRQHSSTLEKIQDGSRKAEDVFPAFYRLNTIGAVRAHFPAKKWENYSYTYSSEPSYHFGKTYVARLIAAVQYLKSPFGGESLLVFVRKL
ncbi:class I SAM-dependent methyltransferase [Stakelama marina]|uniref:Class I SAM-dependent methyltransferase n=1 Tax=Stakelama marina TaxID=2826939 RepID=A0A8T4IE26_9SPHN|nr:class I SAM-dependent methyltransferase [Stakelama marina]MBR0552104.1 class I SAM-dependent methyltransferase [Stakelama marina]